MDCFHDQTRYFFQNTCIPCLFNSVSKQSYDYYLHVIHHMEKSEIRKKQWEIGQSLLSSLRKGKVLKGKVGTIIRICGLKVVDGGSVAKFLERAENMPHTPFKVSRKKSTFDGCMYHITLKDTAGV
jgi:hypothetical protein